MGDKAYQEYLGGVQDKETTLRTTMLQAQKVNPDQHVKNVKLGQQAGMIPEAVAAMPDEAQERAMLNSPPMQSMFQHSPATAKYLSNPDNAAVSHDDVEKMAELERVGRQGFGRQKPGSTMSIATDQDRQQAADIGERGGLKDSAVDRAVRGFMPRLAQKVGGLEQMIGEAPVNTPSLFGVQLRGALAEQGRSLVVGSKPDAEATQARGLGAEILQGVVDMAPAIVLAPFTGGASVLADMGLGGAGSKYAANRSAGKPQGASAISAGAAGALYAATGELPVGQLMKPGYSLFKRTIMTTLANTLGMDVAEAGSLLVDKATVNPEMTLKDALSDLAETSAMGVAQGVAMPILSHPMEMLHEKVTGMKRGPDAVDPVAKAQQHADTLEQMGATVQESKTHGRMPEKVAEHIAEIKKAHGGEVDNAYVSVEKWNELFQKAGMDPAQVAESVLSDPRRYTEALHTGSDIAIPLEEFVTKLSGMDQYKELIQDTRMGQGDMTPREAQEFKQTEKERATEVLNQVDKASKAEEPARKVYEDVKRQLIEAGGDPKNAEKEASLYRSAFRTLGERAGVDPLELYNQYRLQINREGVNAGDSEQGKAPQETQVTQLRPSVKVDGKQLDGEPGSDHLATRKAAGFEPGDGDAGFVAADGKWMSRKEAKAWVKKNQPEVFKKLPKGEMHSQPYADAVEKAGQTLNQPGDALGKINIGPDGINISLLEKANLSTFLHETGHFYYKVLSDLAAPESAPAQIKDDFQKLLDWFGAKDRSQVTTEHQEQLARGFEQYLMEGKAPSAELRPAFQRIKNWMKNVYKELRNLNVNLTDDVRGVFDRLLASDDEIAQAEQLQGYKPLFATAEKAGMTEAEFDAYRKDAEKAHDAASSKLEAEAIKDITREQKKMWREEKSKVQEEVTAEMQADPAQQAIQQLTKGKDFEGKETPVKMDRQALVDAYGEPFLKRLPKGSAAEFVYAAEGGLHPDIVAEQFGFGSGDEMLKRMIAAPRMSKEVGAETNRRMKERHGDLLTDGSIKEKALKAVHGDEQGKVLRAELQAIRRKAKEVKPFTKVEKDAAKAAAKQADKEREYNARWKEAEQKLAVAIERGAKQEEIDRMKAEAKAAQETAKAAKKLMEATIPGNKEKENAPPLEFFKELSRLVIGEKAPRDIEPHTYSRAEAKAGREAFDAAARGSYAEAGEAKQKQILNHYLYTEARRAKDDAEKIVKYMASVDTSKALGKVGLASQEMQGQVRAILGRYEFKKISLASLDREKTLQQYLDDMRESYDRDIPIDPRVLDEQHKVNYQEVSIDELRAAYDAVRALVHTAAEINKVTKDGEKILLDEAIDGMIERADTSIPKKRKQYLSDSSKGKPGSWERFKNVTNENIMNFLDSPSRVEFIMEHLDGGKQGPWHDFLWNKYLEANNAKNELKEQLLPQLKDILDDMPADRKSRLYESKHIDSLGTKLTHLEMISAALNVGNESNQDKLMRGGIQVGQFKSEIHREALDEILGHLDKADWDMVQGLWNTVNSFWPAIEALEKRWTGIAPEKVQARKVVTPFGEYDGGYWPVAYDSRTSSFGEKQAQSSKVDQAFGPDFTRASTRTGHTNERTEAAAPLKLDFRAVMTKHLDNVITDLTHREFVDQFNRIIRNPKLKEALINSMGEQGYANMRGWGKSIVNADNYADASVVGAEKMWRAAKTNMTVAALGLNAGAAIADVGIVPIISMARGVGLADFAKGAAQFIKHPKETIEFMHEKSPAMRHHGMEIDQSITQTMDYLSGQDTHLAQVKRFSMGMRSWIYNIGTTAGWMASYKQEMSKGTDEKSAVRIADKTVRMTQHAGDVGSLSALERHPFFKHFMMFSGPVVIAYNNMLYGAKEIHQRGATPEALGKIFAMWFGQGILWSLLRGKGPDDDESYSGWLARHAVMGPLEAYPVIRDVLPSVEGLMTGHYKPARNLPIYSMLENAARAGVTTYKWLNGEAEAGKALKADLSAAGSLAGIPSNQIDVTGSFLYEVLTGEYHPKHVLSPLHDLIYRRKKGE